MTAKVRLTALGIAASLVVCGSLALASGASAAFHLTKIREISGDSGGNNTSYVELQMYAAGQTQIVGHDIVCYDATGAITDTFPITNPDATILNGGNQRTVLIGDSNVLGGRDLRFNPDSCLGSPDPAGAICFATIDCVSWGGAGFTGTANLPDRATPFGGTLPFDTALRRRIGRGCTNLLEAVDDTNNSAANFTDVARDPTRNSVAPGSTRCIGAPKCGGVRVTRSGTARADLLSGNRRRNVIRGLRGNDIIRGRGGNDVLCGGKGKDRLVGGRGRDRLIGGPGRDVCIGGPGKDVYRGCEIKR
jgi:Ca2+-binding RTX toxin-like protein